MNQLSPPPSLARFLAPAGSGFPAGQPENHAEPAKLAAVIGQALAELHAVPVADVPVAEVPADAATEVAVDAVRDASAVPVVDPADPESVWRRHLQRCAARVSDGAVDTSALPDPYKRYPADQLVAFLQESNDGWDDDSPPVICHGAPAPNRFMVDGGKFVGFDHLSTWVIADRHLDLAVAHLGIAAALGSEAVFGLYQAYGYDPNLLRLDHYLLMVQLLGLVS